MKPVKKDTVDFIVPPKQTILKAVGAEEAILLKQSSPNRQKKLPLMRTTTSYIDVMVLYTQEYANDARSGLQAQIQLSIDYANTALQNSNIDMVYRLDYTQLYENSGSNENVSIDDALNYLTNDDSVKQLRARERSDLVTLFRFNNTGGTVGLGWLANSTNRLHFRTQYSFNVSEFDEITFAHEAGHNLGCGHDRTLGCQGLHSYSCGYYDDSTGHGTIMSYSNNPFQYFSSPDITVNGETIGAADTDCARTIRETKFIMAMNDTVAENNEAGDVQNGTTLSGSIDENDNDSFALNLGGSTTFTLDSQYSNAAFFINIYKDGNYLITSTASDSQNYTFENGEYIIVVSLCNENGCYSSQKDYTVTYNTNYIAPQSSDNNISAAIIMYLLN